MLDVQNSKPTGLGQKVQLVKRRTTPRRGMSEPSLSRPVAISSLAVRIESFVSGVQTPPGWRVVALDVAVLPKDGHDRGDGHLDG